MGREAAASVALLVVAMDEGDTPSDTTEELATCLPHSMVSQACRPVASTARARVEGGKEEAGRVLG